MLRYYLVSQDPANYRDAPTEGIRRILETVTGEKIERGTILPTNKIGEALILSIQFSASDKSQITFAFPRQSLRTLY
jgi:hypothetical protein